MRRRFVIQRGTLEDPSDKKHITVHIGIDDEDIFIELTWEEWSAALVFRPLDDDPDEPFKQLQIPHANQQSPE